MATKIILTICCLVEAVLALDLATAVEIPEQPRYGVYASTGPADCEGAVGILGAGILGSNLEIFGVTYVSMLRQFAILTLFIVPTGIFLITAIEHRQRDREKLMKPCPVCRKFIAKTAETCPRCGDPQRQDSQAVD